MFFLFGTACFSQKKITIDSVAKICQNQSYKVLLSDNKLNWAYQWQDSLNGVWANISDDQVFQGNINDTLSITNCPVVLNGRGIRCLVDTTNNSIFDDTTNTMVITSPPP